MNKIIPLIWCVLNVLTTLNAVNISSVYNTKLFRSMRPKHIPKQNEQDSQALDSRRNGYPYQCNSYPCYDNINTQYQYEYPVEEIHIEEVPVYYPYEQQQYLQTCHYTKFTQAWYQFCYMYPYSTCCYCQGCIWPIQVPDHNTPTTLKTTTTSTKKTTSTTKTKTMSTATSETTSETTPTTTKTTTTTTMETTPTTNSKTTTTTTTPKNTPTTTKTTETTPTTTTKSTPTTETTTPKTTTTTEKQHEMYEYRNV